MTLTAQDVLDFSDTTDTLSIFGDSKDTVDAGTGWTDGGPDGNGYNVYTQTVGGDLVTLLIDPDIATNPDIV